jgi:glucose-1-phosphate thymidylyltransferase
VVALEEKPEAPRSDLVSTATYLFAEAHVALIGDYLEAGNAPDPPGRFLAWLCEHEAVYGFRFSDDWLDIGELSQLLAADNRYRERAGLPLRTEYAPN